MENENPDFKIGATGDYPRGKARPDDEGGLTFAMRANPKNGCVEIDFGKSVAWLALEPDLAIGLARELMERAAYIQVIQKLEKRAKEQGAPS